MNIRHGFLLLGLTGAIGGWLWTMYYAYVRWIDKWITSHPRAIAAMIYVALAVIVFLIGARE